jgi:Fic family protein
VKGSSEYEEKAKSAIAFKSYFNPFRDFSADHAAFIATNPDIELVNSRGLPFRIGSRVATQLTKWSLALEGILLTEVEATEVSALISRASFSTEEIPASPYNSETKQELQEAFQHILALYFGQARLVGQEKQSAVQKRERFQFSLDDMFKIHEVLMQPFPNVSPGSLRTNPVVSIQVKGYPAVFPYSAEVPALMQEFCEWANKTPIHHPLLFAADLFLNFCHIHPFVDGNGRLGRLLCTLALSYYGIEPVKFVMMDRVQYLQVVFEAQQEQKRSHFYALMLSSFLRERVDVLPVIPPA